MAITTEHTVLTMNRCPKLSILLEFFAALDIPNNISETAIT